MSGNISTEEKCSVCEGKMIHDERRKGCFCETHTEITASRLFRVRFGKKINKRYRTYDLAYQFLMGLRYEKANGKLDIRDHMYSNPLGFANLGKKYVEFKEKQGLTEMNNIRRYIRNATEYFKGTNVKEIKKKNIRAFLDSLTKSIKGEKGDDIQVPLADKGKACHCSQLHDMFFNFLYDEEEVLELAQLPRFPKVDENLGFRKLIDIGDRELIINSIKESTYEESPKIWLGIDLLCSYGRIRPLDLRRLTEEDIDLEYGVMTFWRPSKSKKNKAPKVVSIKLLPDHIDEFRVIKKRFPGLGKTLFFRHPPGIKGVRADYPFSKSHLYNHWIKVCKEFGIDDVDLYGGTRHSSTTAIGKAMGKKEAKSFSGHNSNAAFDRYCQIGDQDDLAASQLMAKMRGKVIDFDEEKRKKK